MKPFKVVDLFAGPGGLGEGFAARESYRITVSVEMEATAHRTLRLRAFLRNLKRDPKADTGAYYELCSGAADVPEGDEPLRQWDAATAIAWRRASAEALRLELGRAEDDRILDRVISGTDVGPLSPWVLIGGPPCQAYSLVGRSRNKNKVTRSPDGEEMVNYRAENDERHYLYLEYLRIIDRFQPAIFVMENVKGILSSKVKGRRIFHNILTDLSDPSASSGGFGLGRHKYQIHSLVSDTVFRPGDDPASIDAHRFVVRAEEHGIPQARHRVFLIGVRDDVAEGFDDSGQTLAKLLRLSKTDAPSVGDVIGDLPPIRSRLTGAGEQGKNSLYWQATISKFADGLARSARTKVHHDFLDLAESLERVARDVKPLPTSSEERLVRDELKDNISSRLWRWYLPPRAEQRLFHHLNHDTRGHMGDDLRRYLYAAVFAQCRGISPKGYKQFVLAGLEPRHKNWTSGKFSDRFRVQLKDRPSTTVTCHLSKDGHYFIHYDPMQCRSLTVREAARLQTFPDDYYFQGSPTDQRRQVGNAVPPFLAHQISGRVLSVLQLFSDKHSQSGKVSPEAVVCS